MPTAQLLADDLERFLSGRPVLARPVGFLAKGWRWCRRNPLVAILTGSVAVLVVSFGIAGWVTASKLLVANQVARDRFHGQLLAERASTLSMQQMLAQRSLALETINELIERTEIELAKRPSLLPLRQDLLKEMQYRLERVVEVGANGDRDASIARSHARLASVNWLRGNAVEAGRQLQVALEIIEPLAKQSPTDRDVQACYAFVLDELGNQSQMNHQFENAERYYAQSTAILETLILAGNGGDRERKNISFAHSRQGDVAILIGEVEKARSHYSLAAREATELLESNPLDQSLLRLATRCHERLSWASGGLGQLDEAALQLARGLNYNQRLLDLDATNFQAEVDRCNLLYSRADIDLRQGDFRAAGEASQQSIESGERLIELDPKNAELRWSQALHLEQLATIQTAQEEFAAAVQSLRKAYYLLIETVDGEMASVKFRQSLIKACATLVDLELRLGRRDEVAAWTGRLEQSIAQLDPQSAANPIFAIVALSARESVEALQAIDENWALIDQTNHLTAAVRLRAQWIAAYHQARSGTIESAAKLLRNADGFDQQVGILRYVHATGMALGWGLIADQAAASSDSPLEAEAVKRASSFMREALQANSLGRTELGRHPELAYVRKVVPNWTSP